MIRFHLIQGGNRDFELDIARFTNQQNPTEPRDFWAYDEVQVRLQNESFKTNYWYEIRRGEFREKPDNEVVVVSNEDFAEAYAAFVLKLSFDEDYIFVSNKKIKQGLYEIIFNNKTIFEDMLVAYKIMRFINYKFPSEKKISLTSGEQMDLIIHRILLEKLYPTNFNAHIDLLLEKNRKYLNRLSVYIAKEWASIPSEYMDENHFINMSFSFKDLEDESLDEKYVIPF